MTIAEKFSEETQYRVRESVEESGRSTGLSKQRKSLIKTNRCLKHFVQMFHRGNSSYFSADVKRKDVDRDGTQEMKVFQTKHFQKHSGVH
jgi:hypothetical protein